MKNENEVERNRSVIFRGGKLYADDLVLGGESGENMSGDRKFRCSRKK